MKSNFGDLLNKVSLILVVGSAISVHHVMEPECRHRISLLWWPRVVGLGSSEDKAPVNSPNLILLEDWQVSNKFGTCLASHIFSADDWPFKAYHLVDKAHGALYITISVESDDIAFWEYIVVDVIVVDIAIPKPWCQWLRWVHKPTPSEYFPEQRKAFL